MTDTSLMRLAIISDLHCHHSAAKYKDSYLLSDRLRDPPGQHPVQAFLDFVGKHDDWHADGLLLLGDITSRVDAQGLISGWGFIAEIAAALDASFVIPTLGNHDVDWKGVYDSTHPSGEHDQLARCVGRGFPYSERSLWSEFFSHGVVSIVQRGVQFVVLNSAHGQRDETLAKQGILSTQQAQRIREHCSSVSDVLRVFVMHHHPVLHRDVEWSESAIMTNGEMLTQLAEELSPALIVHGHKHQARVTSTNGTAGVALPVFCAGSFSAIPSGSNVGFVPNMCHIIDVVNHCGRATGTIHTSVYHPERGWSEQTTGEHGFPSHTGLGLGESISSLKDKLIALYKENASDGALLQWAQVLESEPSIAYLSPGELSDLGRHLDEQGYQFVPAPPNTPTVLGKKYGGQHD